MKSIALIVAATEELGIGVHGNLPWRLPKDMAFFKHATSHVPSSEHGQNVVIMGRVTWESIPARFRPLDNRLNIVVSRNTNYDLGLDETTRKTTLLVNSFEKALVAVDPAHHARVFVIGGAQMYSLAIRHPACSHILLTRITSKVECDTFFPVIDKQVFYEASHQALEDYVEQAVPKGIQTHKDIDYEFTLYIRK
ncbi:dihydrofolate reductase [Gilbertella persicaria]|uniref:Dihydrofolate reductase n=1 Tax=Rhizopus stolonifer TaxID=4846 RepID=A0A367KQE3_RHIST|nr:dihydrofolate reductase [Gilbertella persicaria]KAI8075822.1 dihydrofolate reductase [Gilbertella persicaria]RCI04391.1 dihydrofolate reductase [Rhizopus stolonifer]